MAVDSIHAASLDFTFQSTKICLGRVKIARGTIDLSNRTQTRSKYICQQISIPAHQPPIKFQPRTSPTIWTSNITTQSTLYIWVTKCEYRLYSNLNGAYRLTSISFWSRSSLDSRWWRSEDSADQRTPSQLSGAWSSEGLDDRKDRPRDPIQPRRAHQRTRSSPGLAQCSDVRDEGRCIRPGNCPSTVHAWCSGGTSWRQRYVQVWHRCRPSQTRPCRADASVGFGSDTSRVRPTTGWVREIGRSTSVVWTRRRPPSTRSTLGQEGVSSVDSRRTICKSSWFRKMSEGTSRFPRQTTVGHRPSIEQHIDRSGPPLSLRLKFD